MTSRIVYVSRLQHEVRTDALTSLANRRGLVERLEEDMARARRSFRPLSVAMLDLDRFKEYNDTFGHVAGDRLLQVYAQLLSTVVRVPDTVARYGGDEFCVVLPDTDLEGATDIVDRMHRAIDGAELDGQVVFSAGVARWDGSEDASALIERADQALYRTKQRRAPVEPLVFDDDRASPEIDGIDGAPTLSGPASP